MLLEDHAVKFKVLQREKTALDWRKLGEPRNWVKLGVRIGKAVRRQKGKRFIAVTCHYDVVDWLEPDWVFCTDTMVFDRKKESGRPLNSKFIGAATPLGRFFGSIII